jgi:hypothetical protein
MIEFGDFESITNIGWFKIWRRTVKVAVKNGFPAFAEASARYCRVNIAGW